MTVEIESLGMVKSIFCCLMDVMDMSMAAMSGSPASPVFMKGMVKSTACCLMEVMDMSMAAMSACWDLSSAIMPVHFPFLSDP